MTNLTLITIAVILFGMFSSRGYGWALALGGATAAGAAVVVGETTVPTFYAVAIGTVVAVVLRFLSTARSPQPTPERKTLAPGVLELLLFLLWSTLVTLIAPVLFDGLAVRIPTDATRRLTAGDLTSSNIAQMIYLVLGVCVVAFLARSASAVPQLIGLAAGATTLLSLWRYLHQIAGFPFPDGLFDNSPGFAYIETAANDVKRFRGILSEPAALAASSLVTISYMIPRSFHLRGWRRAGAFAVAGVAAYLGSISTSATFVVAGGVIALIAVVSFGLGFLLRGRSVSALVGIGCCALVIAALWLVPIVARFVEATINEKVSSSSYDDRSALDTVSLGIFLDTFGIGTGLGANRASSFFAGLLSTTGLIGTVLFAVTVATLIYRGGSVREYRPVVWALVAFLVVKIVSGPDLSDSTGILWMSLGLLSHAAQRPEARPAPFTSAPWLAAPPPGPGLSERSLARR